MYLNLITYNDFQSKVSSQQVTSSERVKLAEHHQEIIAMPVYYLKKEDSCFALFLFRIWRRNVTFYRAIFFGE